MKKFVLFLLFIALVHSKLFKRIDINWGDLGALENADRNSKWMITRYSSGKTLGVDYGHNSVLAVPIDDDGKMIPGSQSILIDLVTYDHEGTVINNILSYISQNKFSAENFPVSAKSDVSIGLKTYAVPNNRVAIDSFITDNPTNPSKVLNTMGATISDQFPEGKDYFRFDPSSNCQGLAKSVMTGLQSAFAS
jgi:hypothetical protein